jgi:hypothetical protein
MSLHNRVAEILRSADWRCHDTCVMILECICEVYSASIVAVSDAQATHLSEFFGSRPSFCSAELRDIVYGRAVEDFFASEGNIANSHIRDQDVFKFLTMRIARKYPDPRGILARPNHMLPVLIRVCDAIGDHDLVDPHIHELDHVSVNVFVPNSFADFWQDTIRAGRNHSFQIGHDIWTVQDFMSHWSKICVQTLIEVRRG